jgi:hypothetical protein
MKQITSPSIGFLDTRYIKVAGGNSAANIIIENDYLDGNITFKVNDGGVDTTVMTVDGATGYIGIGTTGPGAILGVAGSSAITWIKISSTFSTDDFNRGLLVLSTQTVSFSAKSYYGIDSRPCFSATSGTQLAFYGITMIPTATISSNATITGAYGGYYRVDNQSTAGAIITNAYGVYVANPIATGTITNNYGLYIASQTAGSTLDYAIYSAGGQSYFAGNVGIGTISPSTKLHTEETKTIAALTADEYSATITINSKYTAASAQTVTRHNYLDIKNPTLTNVTITDAAVMRFDAAAGTHPATIGATTKTTPSAVNAWLKVNINGIIHYMPAYLSTTA